ncbi:TetR/AcrR family transcriptional regulator C-terminal domain-containing protein [Peterkaempfera bronchialis]|uniref:TetR/AcrR family transcriptional regulator C-terminal domain-containing protein n=1 Tax=Peterkaempfera bronchialis TaxID=2126346 RepID=UPI003C30D170
MVSGRAAPRNSGPGCGRGRARGRGDRLRRLVIANADTFPGLGATWYEEGFERVLATLAATFERLAADGLLRIDEPLLAANHFSGLLLWIPVNKAMFHGSLQHTRTDLDHHAAAGVRTFLAAYR